MFFALYIGKIAVCESDFEEIRFCLCSDILMHVAITDKGKRRHFHSLKFIKYNFFCLILREAHKLRVPDNRVFRKVFDPKGAALLVGRSRDRFPVVSLDFSVTYFLPTAPWPWGRLSS